MGQRKKMMLWASFGIIFIAVAGLAAYFAVFERPNPVLKRNQVRIRNAVFDVEVAATAVAKARGLSFRDGLAENHGMLFFFDRPGVQSFWMKDMSFPIDIIWIGGGKVTGFAENAAPAPGAALWNLKIYASPDGTDRVLEVNAGIVAKYHLRVGDAAEVVI